jgi:LAS superfamily LD-carboxypeptidase LdcB
MENTNYVDWNTEQWREFGHWLKDIMRTGTVNVEFTKVDGTNRTMNATLDLSLVPRVEPLSETTIKSKRDNPDVLVCWDVDAGGWRSFRLNSVINVIDLLLKYR